METSSEELTEWRAYYELEPFGELIADQRHGIATSVLANVNRNVKSTPEPYKATDFIYWHQTHRRPKVSGGELSANAEAQSNLLKALLFRKK